MAVASSLCHSRSSIESTDRVVHRDRRRRREACHHVMPSVRNTLWAWLATILLLQAQCDAFASHSLKHSDTRTYPGRTRIRMVNTNGEHYTNGEQNHVVPRHVALICDGNSRWAKARRLPISVGHLAGADRLIDSIQTLKRAGVQCITFYGFSTENWKRPPQEIEDILSVMEHTARNFYSKALEENVRVKILGDLQDERIPNGLRGILSKLERDTCQNTVTVCIAVNYGGRQDILHASLRLAEAISSGQIQGENVTEDYFSSFLCTSDVPNPDLMIRTGGEKRLSNFLLWNSAYSELYFSDVLWPDFDEIFVMEALEWYSTRSRRFGGRNSQVTAIV